jgi:hypothetical protein
VQRYRKDRPLFVTGETTAVVARLHAYFAAARTASVEARLDQNAYTA